MNQTRNFLLRHSILVALIVLFLIMLVLFRDKLLSRGVLLSFLHSCTILGLLTVGQSIVLVSGGIDLSNGTLVGMTSIIAAWIALQSGVPWILVGSLVVCLVIGCVSSSLIIGAGFPPLIGTLVAMGIAEGITYTVTRGSPLPLNNETLVWFGQANAWGIPFYSLVWIGIVIAAYLVLSRTTFGRHVYSVGGSEKFAYRCGVNVKRVKLAVYLTSALLAWLAGIVYVSYAASGAARAGGGGGFSYMLDSASASIIGGVSLSGGRGNVLDATLGTMFFALLYMSVIFLNISPVLEGAFRGILLLIVVLYAYLRETRPQ